MRKVGYYWVWYDKSKEVAYWNGDEWVLCGIDLHSNEFTDDSMKGIYEDIISFDDDPLRSKGDFMKAVSSMDNRVKEIDSAIPVSISKALLELSIDPNMHVMVYWKTGNHEVVNIAAHWAMLINNK